MKSSKAQRPAFSVQRLVTACIGLYAVRCTLNASRARSARGFTLVEMMVAVSLFAIVMTVSVGSLLSLVEANRKAQALQSVMNNLNIALDGMVRSIRMGTDYHCGDLGALDQPRDCTSGGELVAFEAFGGSPSDPNDQWVYWVEDGRLYKSESSSNYRANGLPITAPEITIDSFEVYVTGSEPLSGGDTTQPKVVIVVQGTAGAAGNAIGIFGSSEKIRTTFNIQSVASQRLLDL